jgi:hypothetical protein
MALIETLMAQASQHDIIHLMDGNDMAKQTLQTLDKHMLMSKLAPNTMAPDPHTMQQLYHHYHPHCSTLLVPDTRQIMAPSDKIMALYSQCNLFPLMVKYQKRQLPDTDIPTTMTTTLPINQTPWHTTQTWKTTNGMEYNI